MHVLPCTTYAMPSGTVSLFSSLRATSLVTPLRLHPHCRVPVTGAAREKKHARNGQRTKCSATDGEVPRASTWSGLMALLRIRAVLLLDRFLDKQQGAQEYNADCRFLTGPWEPVMEENFGLEAKVVEGALPSDLRGVFLRIGPNPPVPPTKRHHVFDGEGMIHSVRFHEGQVLYSNSFIETQKMRFERELGEPFFTRIGELYGIWGLAKALLTIPHRQTRDLKPPEVAAVNTAMCLTPQGKFYALNEGGAPFELELNWDGAVERLKGFETKSGRLDFALSKWRGREGGKGSRYLASARQRNFTST